MPFLFLEFSGIGVVSKSGGTSESGLAGVVPDGSWLPALPNGSSVGPMPATLPARFNTLYKTFGNAWRVTNSKSLFDYAPGTSTATFTNAAWPVENATSCSLPKVNTPARISAAAAEAACGQISNATLHSNCVADVQATGNRTLADTYAVGQRVHNTLIAKPLVLTAKPTVIEPNFEINPKLEIKP